MARAQMSNATDVQSSLGASCESSRHSRNQGLKARRGSRILGSLYFFFAMRARKRPMFRLEDAATEPLLWRLLDDHPHSIAIFRPDGRPGYLNRSFFRLLAIAPERSAEFAAGYCIFADEVIAREGLSELVRRAFSGEAVVLPTIRLEVYDATEYEPRQLWVHGQLYPLRANDGHIERVAWIQEDVSDRVIGRRHEQELRDRIHDSQKSETMTVLAAGVAHDFNNLLTAIMGNADLARERVPGNPLMSLAMERIVVASTRAGELCNQLVAFAGRGDFVRRPVDLSVLLDDAVPLLEAAVLQRIEIVKEIEDDLPPVHADPTQLRQVLMNLLTNAAEAISEGAEKAIVTVGARRVPPPPELQGDDRGEGERPLHDYVLLQVADNGAGMTSEAATKVFEPFFTTKSPSTSGDSKRRNRGLGLAVVRSIVRRHGGDISLSSELGRGTSFDIYLPVSGEGRQREATGQQHALRHGSVGVPPTGRVLIVDDEPAVRMLAKAVLEYAGYATLSAINGSEALELYAAHKDELLAILLDLNMPGIHGRKVYEELRKSDERIPVLLSSGLEGWTPPPGRHRFLAKPYRPQDLLDELATLLGG